VSDGVANPVTLRSCKYNRLRVDAAPSPVGEGWGDDCMDAGGRATQGAVAEENKNSYFNHPHPNLLPEGEGAHTLKSTLWHSDLYPRGKRSGYLYRRPCLLLSSLQIHNFQNIFVLFVLFLSFVDKKL
jgi:hypothetical protein